MLQPEGFPSTYKPELNSEVNETPPDWNAGHRERLRQRFERTGFAGFSDYEVVELLLTLCIPRRDVKQPAKALLKHFGNLKGVLDAEMEELRAIEGIGKVTPVALRIIREAAHLYLQQGAEGREILNSASRVEAFWRSRLSGLTREVFEVAYLDKAYRLLPNGVERMEVGTVDRTVVYPRKVVEAALRRSASALLLAHNHPTGRAYPSEADITLTKMIQKAAAPLDIRIIDHLIVAGSSVFSFRSNQML